MTGYTLSQLIESSTLKVLELRQSGSNREQILSYLTELADRLSGPESCASILILDAEGLLRNGASPKLPTHYLAAIDGFNGWSMPIKNENGKVIGTFGTYFLTPRQPSLEEQQGIAHLANAAAVAITMF